MTVKSARGMHAPHSSDTSKPYDARQSFCLSSPISASITVTSRELRGSYGESELSCLQVGAHEVLADLLMRYMAELSSTSHSYAELAGRTATNISDVARS